MLDISNKETGVGGVWQLSGLCNNSVNLELFQNKKVYFKKEMYGDPVYSQSSYFLEGRKDRRMDELERFHDLE